MNALITGILGFCGRHLAAELAQHGLSLYGIDRLSQPAPPATVLYTGDLRDREFLCECLRASRPAYVYHLAALTDPAAGLDTLYDVNVRGTLHLLDAVRLTGLDPVILIAGSSAAYGAGQTPATPIDEATPFRPANCYAVSKIAQEMVGVACYAQHGQRVVRTRAFNLFGPGESASFVTSAFARQIAAVEAGLQEPSLQVGNLSAVRDFTDVRDAVRAYRLVAERAESGSVYNVCSGRATPISSLLSSLLALSRVPGIDVRPDPSRLQPADVPVQVGDGSRLRRDTGWAPAIPMEVTLADVLDHWRRFWEERRTCEAQQQGG